VPALVAGQVDAARREVGLGERDAGAELRAAIAGAARVVQRAARRRGRLVEPVELEQGAHAQAVEARMPRRGPIGPGGGEQVQCPPRPSAGQFGPPAELPGLKSIAVLRFPPEDRAQGEAREMRGLARLDAEPAPGGTEQLGDGPVRTGLVGGHVVFPHDELPRER